MDTAWLAEAKCRDMDPQVFFPNESLGVRAAQRICSDCPVKRACLEYALDERIAHGVWGGASERERRRILRHRHIAQLQAAQGRWRPGPGRESRDLVREAVPDAGEISA